MLFSTFFILLLLSLFTTFPSSIEAISCTSFGQCTPANKWKFGDVKVPENVEKEECDACSIFLCLVDNEKVMFGAGCLDEFEKRCSDFSNIKIGSDYFFKSDSGYYVIGCQHDDYCAKELLTNNIQTSSLWFENQFIKGPVNATDRCIYDPSMIDNNNNDDGSSTIAQSNDDKTTQTPSDAGLMNQMDGFKLFGMILSGFALAQFW